MGSWSLAKAGGAALLAEAALLAAVVVLGGLGDLGGLELLASADFAPVQKVAAVKKGKKWYFVIEIVLTYCKKKMF